MKMAAFAVSITEWVIRITLSIVGMIHVLPMIGITGRIALEKAYGIAINSPDLQLLLQHRAVLFGLLGVACFIAVFNPPWRPAVWCAMISTCSFLLLAGLAPSSNAAIVQVIWFDVAAIAMLLIAAAAHAFRQS